MQKNKQQQQKKTVLLVTQRNNNKTLKDYLILQGIEAFEDEFKQSVQVVRAWGGHKNIGVTGEKTTQKSVFRTSIQLVSKSQ